MIVPTSCNPSLSSCLKSTGRGPVCAIVAAGCGPSSSHRPGPRESGSTPGSLPAADRRRSRKSGRPHRIGKVCTIPFYHTPCARPFRRLFTPRPASHHSANEPYLAGDTKLSRSRKKHVRRLAGLPSLSRSPYTAVGYKKARTPTGAQHSAAAGGALRYHHGSQYSLLGGLAALGDHRLLFLRCHTSNSCRWRVIEQHEDVGGRNEEKRGGVREGPCGGETKPNGVESSNTGERMQAVIMVATRNGHNDMRTRCGVRREGLSTAAPRMTIYREFCNAFF